MEIRERALDRMASIAIYTGLAALSLWAGTALINRSLENRFREVFVVPWEIGNRALQSHGAPWPLFTGANHVAYMESLCRMMRERGLSVPESNTARPYVYGLRRLGSPREGILVLCLPDGLVFYGMSGQTAKGTDRFIDGVSDLEAGAFTAMPQEGGRTYTGRWRS